MPEGPETHVVTAFLLRRDPREVDRFLLLHRSDRVRTYPGSWAGVSGYLEESTPLRQVWKELREEVGLAEADLRLVAEGDALAVDDLNVGRRWRVHPFLFELTRPEHIGLDWEHSESRWLRLADLASLPTVPGLVDALLTVYLPAPEEI